MIIGIRQLFTSLERQIIQWYLFEACILNKNRFRETLDHQKGKFFDSFFKLSHYLFKVQAQNILTMVQKHQKLNTSTK